MMMMDLMMIEAEEEDWEEDDWEGLENEQINENFQMILILNKREKISSI